MIRNRGETAEAESKSQNVTAEAFMNEQTTKGPDRQAALAEGRTQMASFRTTLALDRTTLAWIRTALTMSTFGFALVGFFRSLRLSNPNDDTIRLHEGAILFGTALIIFGIVVMIVAALWHLFTVRRLRRGEIPVLSGWPLSVVVAMLLAFGGLTGIWLLFTH
jgi:putative membrane protein